MHNLWYRNRFLLLADALLCLLIFPLTLFLRLDRPDLIQQSFESFWLLILPIVGLKVLIFYAFGFYKRAWYYASTPDLMRFVLGVGASGIMVFALTTLVNSPIGPYHNFNWFPRSYFAIDGLLTLILLGGLRLMIRYIFERTESETTALYRDPRKQKRVLVVGAGDAGVAIAREMKRNAQMGYVVVGFIDYNERKQGLMIQGVPVVGLHKDIPQVIERYHPDEVIVAIPTAPGSVIRRVSELARSSGVPVKVLPGIYELIDGKVSLKQMRDVQITDLLRRQPVALDNEAISDYLTGARVMVTGAGGSIGSELCRKIASFNPSLLVMLGRGENSIYHIEREIRNTFPHLKIQTIIGDVKDALKLDWVIGTYRPEVVFHAAAHKHVPLMEANVEETLSVNIMGTKNVAEAAARHKVRRFVLISTDKAVNPVNAMGASKRIAELILQDLSNRFPTTDFVAVRFGNVLGSRGSVVPLFQEQIAAGGPITITHPEITRYFMTIPEASSLVIQAGAMAHGGEIFVLDMGEPVKIVDLARDLIRLSGFEVDRDISIEFVGLRPGEKMYEELLNDIQHLQHTRHQKIFIQPPLKHPVNHEWLEKQLQELEEIASTFNHAALRERLLELSNTDINLLQEMDTLKSLPPHLSDGTKPGND